MVHNKLSIKNAILYAVNAVVSYPWYFIKLTLAWMLFSFLIIIPVFFFLISVVAFPSTGSIIVSYFVIYFLGILVWALPIKPLLEFYDHPSNRFSIGMFFSGLKLSTIIKLIGAAMLFHLGVAIGLFLLIIPGIYFAINAIFVFFTIEDTNSGVIAAFKKSFAMVKGNFWRMFLLLLIASILFNLIITIPVSLLMFVHAYFQLKAE